MLDTFSRPEIALPIRRISPENLKRLEELNRALSRWQGPSKVCLSPQEKTEEKVIIRRLDELMAGLCTKRSSFALLHSEHCLIKEYRSIRKQKVDAAGRARLRFIDGMLNEIYREIGMRLTRSQEKEMEELCNRLRDLYDRAHGQNCCQRCQQCSKAGQEIARLEAEIDEILNPSLPCHALAYKKAREMVVRTLRRYGAGPMV